MIRTDMPYQPQFLGFVQLRPEISQKQLPPTYTPRPQQMDSFQPYRSPFNYSAHNTIHQQNIYMANTRVPSDYPVLRPQIQKSPMPSYPAYNPMPAVPFVNTQQMPFVNKQQMGQQPNLPPQRPPKQWQTRIGRTIPTHQLESPKENVPNPLCIPPAKINFPKERYPTFPECPLSTFGREITTIQPPSLATEHKLQDIPQWNNVPVKQLPRQTFEHICTRLDTMCPTGETRNFRDLALRAEYRLSLVSNTESLLLMWNPILSELIEKLQEMECKQLVSEIIENLKKELFITFQPQNNLYSRCIRQESDPFQSIQRRETPPIPIRSTSRPDSNNSSPSPSPSSSPPSTTRSLTPEIYVSYHEDDAEIGEEIVRQVRRLGKQVVCNDDVLPGSSELVGTNNYIRDCKRVISVITEKYLEDDIPLLEGITGLLKSVTGKKRTFIPVQVEKTNDLPGYIANIKPIKWSSENKWEHLRLSLEA